MVEVFKEHLEKYLIKLIKNIGDKSLINEIQEEYESLMDEFIIILFLKNKLILLLIKN